jgi:hypothetical protein
MNTTMDYTNTQFARIEEIASDKGTVNVRRFMLVPS